jgi:hypothetical protein
MPLMTKGGSGEDEYQFSSLQCRYTHVPAAEPKSRFTADFGWSPFSFTLGILLKHCRLLL